MGLLVFYFLFYTSKGFQLRAVGLNMTAAEFNGFAVKRYILFSFVVSGVIAGLGGSNIIPVAVGIALKCLGSSPACYLILAMLADVIDHIEYTRGIRTDGLTMSVYSALMVAATPVCNAIFSGILNASGYDQSADVALNTLGQSAAVNTAISVSYIWVETAAYALCAVLVFLWTVEKNLPAEQAAIVERKKGATQ